MIFYVGKRLQITRIGELVGIHDGNAGFTEILANDGGADKSRATRNEYFHSEIMDQSSAEYGSLFARISDYEIEADFRIEQTKKTYFQ